MNTELASTACNLAGSMTKHVYMIKLDTLTAYCGTVTANNTHNPSIRRCVKKPSMPITCFVNGLLGAVVVNTRVSFRLDF